MSGANLLKLIVTYLENHDWYWDEEHFVEVWEHPSTEKDRRTYHCWTVPQWGEYWSSDHLDPVGPKPKKRRYEDLATAIWSQILREEEPETYATFYEMEQ